MTVGVSGGAILARSRGVCAGCCIETAEPIPPCLPTADPLRCDCPSTAVSLFWTGLQFTFQHRVNGFSSCNTPITLTLSNVVGTMTCGDQFWTAPIGALTGVCSVESTDPDYTDCIFEQFQSFAQLRCVEVVEDPGVAYWQAEIVARFTGTSSSGGFSWGRDVSAIYRARAVVGNNPDTPCPPTGLVFDQVATTVTPVSGCPAATITDPGTAVLI